MKMLNKFKRWLRKRKLPCYKCQYSKAIDNINICRKCGGYKKYERNS